MTDKLSIGEMVRLAVTCIEKCWTYEKLKYGDDLYGREFQADDVWEFVEEAREVGMTEFNARYEDIK